VDVADDLAIEFTTRLAFDIPAETGLALLSIATQDGLQRPLALRSIELTLSRGGVEHIIAPSASDPWLSITNPQPGASISASPLVIKGSVNPVNSNPVIIELLTERGGAILTKQILVETPGERFEFEIPLIFTPVTSARDMRLVIRQSVGWAGVNAILDSTPISITP
jgi:hypothetical protein